LKKNFQREVANYLLSKNVSDFVGVPDSTLKHFIDEGLKKDKVLIATREEEAIGISTGMCLAGHTVVVFMQNAGFANSISTISSLVQLYRIPLIFLIGWRGFLSTDAPEHIKIGKIQPQLLKTLGLQSKIMTEKNWKDCCNWALLRTKKEMSSALVIRREFHD
jgi:sulfopyruvate decarboxylase TPP-binding subunit